MNEFPTFEPSEEELIRIAVSEPLEVKISKAIKLLKEFEPVAITMDESGYYLCNSFGKDSGVCHHLCILSGIKFTNNHNVTTLDPPELMRFGRKTYPDMTYHRQPKHLLARMVDKANPPTRRTRWCCMEYKEGGGNGKVKIIGVRAMESARRAGLWKQVVYNRKGGIIICPILYWTEDDIWNFHKKYNLPYCELYDNGFQRLGCIGCPMGNQRKDFECWPQYERMWRKAFERLWDRWHGILNRKGEPRFFEKYGSPEKFYDWWISGVAYNPQDECQGQFMFGEDTDETE